MRRCPGGVGARGEPSAFELGQVSLHGRGALRILSLIHIFTARYVDAVAHTKALIADTRKTTPGLRALEKHAVAAGGGRNHRFGLSDAIMVKDNHLAALGATGETR